MTSATPAADGARCIAACCTAAMSCCNRLPPLPGAGARSTSGPESAVQGRVQGSQMPCYVKRARGPAQPRRAKLPSLTLRTLTP